METRAPSRDPDRGWGHFPDDIRAALFATCRHSLVAWEMLEDGESISDLAASAASSQGGEASIWEARFRQFLAENTGRRRRIEQEFLREVRRPRLTGPEGADSDRVQNAFQDMSSLLTAVDRKVRKSSLSASLLQGTEDPEMMEQTDKARWIRMLVQFIIEAGLPVVALVPDGAESGAIWMRLFGNRRAKTLRNRARCWKRYAEWLNLVRGVSWPRSFADVSGYLEARCEDGCGHSLPGNLMAALSVLEEVGRVPPEHKLSQDTSLKSIVRSLQEERQRDAPPKKRANMYTAAMVIGLELLVLCEEQVWYSRFTAFLMLISLWMCLRVDDLQWIDPVRLVFTDEGLTVILRRSKTTGPGRRAREVPAYVHREASLSGKDWLQAGVGLLAGDEFCWDRAYFVPRPTADWQGTQRRYASPECICTFFRSVLKELRAPTRSGNAWISDGRELIRAELTGFWSGHSGRHWLPTWTAMLGMSKGDRDFLGRWEAGAHQSDEYVVTSKEVVHRLQREVNKKLCQGAE